MKRTILAATDFSPTAARAVAWAAGWARRHEAKVVVFHAFFMNAPVGMFPHDYYDRLRVAASRKLEKVVSGLRRAGADAQALFRTGDAEHEVLSAARNEDASLIAVGTRGLSAFDEIFLGRTAKRVMRRAPCPVLVIHPHDRADPARVRTVLVPTDLSGDAALAVRTAVSLFGKKVRFILLNVCEPPPIVAEFGVPPLPDRFWADLRRLAHARLESAARPLRKAGLRVATTVAEGYAPLVIAAAARAKGADLIVMRTHGRTGLKRFVLGSVAESVIRYARCPVLALH